MRKIKQILAMVMCLCMLMAVAPDPAIADTWDNRGSAFVNLQGGGAVELFFKSGQKRAAEDLLQRR